MIPVTSSHHQAEIRHLLTLQCKAFSWMGMGKGPNFLLLLPGMMLDLLLVRRSGFISVTISTSKTHIQEISNPRCVPEAAAAPSLRLCCVLGKGLKTPISSIQQPAMGTAMPTKATSGSRWPGRMTEVWASPLDLGMEATCSLGKR